MWNSDLLSPVAAAMKVSSLLLALFAIAALVAAVGSGHGADGSLAERVEWTLSDGAAEAQVEATDAAAAPRASLPGRRLAWTDALRAVRARTEGPATPPPEA